MPNAFGCARSRVGAPEADEQARQRLRQQAKQSPQIQLNPGPYRDCGERKGRLRILFDHGKPGDGE